MKITIEIPVATALALRALVSKANAGDQAVAQIVGLLAARGIDITKIKIV